MKAPRAGCILALTAALLHATAARAQEILRVQRGDIHITVWARGTVSVQDQISLTSTIPGRIEDVNAVSTGVWVLGGAQMGDVASERLAAMLDSPTTTDRSVVLERWSSEFPLIPIRCPQDCYVLKILIEPKQWISAGAPLFVAAQTLEMEGKVGAGNARLIQDGQWLTYWARNDPKRRFHMRIENFALDNPGEQESSAGSFAMDMTPSQFFPPGTAWKGFIIPVDHPNALLVPTASLVEFQGAIFLPLPVSTGITNVDWTEIIAGAGEGEPYLMLKNSQLGSAARYQAPKPGLIPAAAVPAAQNQNPNTNQNSPQNQEPDYGGDLYVQ